jgi:rod shape-determining protein MreC
MKSFLNYLLRFREYIILVILIISSLILISQNNNQQLKQIRSSSIQALGYLQENFSIFFKVIWIPRILNLNQENTLLRESNIILSEEVSRLREASLENIRLRNLLNFKQTSKFDLLFAKIVGKSLTLLRNHITLDIGSNSGVQVNMPIITDKGLVGKIVAVSSGYSIGQILRNKDFKASAIDERSRIPGIVGWDGSDNFQLNEVAKNLDIKPGDLLLTSEFSSIFPPNIPIGVVSIVINNTGNLFQSIQITSNVDFNTLEEVFVVKTVPDTARTNFETRFFENN